MSFAVLLLLAASGPVYAEPEVPDPELAVERGGFRLPSGIDVAMTVQSQTALNGAIVLRTVFTVDHGPAMLTVYAPRAGETVVAPAASRGASQGMTPPQLIYDGRGGVQVMPGVARGTVAVGQGTSDTTLPNGLQAIDATHGAVTANGVVSQSDIAGRQIVRLDGTDLSIAHLAGTAFGSVIANTGSDRTIDTTTTLSIDLANAGPDVLGSALLRVEGLALGAMTDRVR